LVTATQKLVKKIPVSVIPKRDLQARLCLNSPVTAKNILCFDELSIKILASSICRSAFGRAGVSGGVGGGRPVAQPHVAGARAAVAHPGARQRGDPRAPEVYLDLELVFC
jgi:hypothetical protein